MTITFSSFVPHPSALLFIKQTQEFSDFKRFSTKSGDATLDAPKP